MTRMAMDLHGTLSIRNPADIRSTQRGLAPSKSPRGIGQLQPCKSQSLRKASLRHAKEGGPRSAARSVKPKQLGWTASMGSGQRIRSRTSGTSASDATVTGMPRSHWAHDGETTGPCVSWVATCSRCPRPCHCSRGTSNAMVMASRDQADRKRSERMGKYKHTSASRPCTELMTLYARICEMDRSPQGG